ncbi:putative translin-associated factor TraX [Talaromyces proteolyticus]|uniref:Translin-associated factor TraX n=1 Tax=Talaromyces proteolyticus TaxID=1131652 RepID=A0AAD4KGV8_9EURO|nr:putative translin-associated factor TraX [Talaromyces proteolyticus]KAH8690097.1 putative translin-associated factor TraX [Talaromyces proteolyticus]
MASSKRSWEGHIVNHAAMATNTLENTETPAFQSIFETFRSELDEHHDRRERVIKASRDITALSKKIIFALQRLRTLNTAIPPSIAKENKTRFDQIRDLFRSIVPDITGINAWRYQRQISGGVQEFIEAVTFQHYIETQKLITREDIVRDWLPEVMVTEEDYLMGVFDLTGEMMRFAVTTLSTGGQVKKEDGRKQEEKDWGGDSAMDTTEDETKSVPVLPESKAGIVVDLRDMRAMLEELNVPRRHRNNLMRDMYKKTGVMQNSVEKVERAAYGILVRGSERPSGWTPDLSTGAGAGTASVEVESY